MENYLSSLIPTVAMAAINVGGTVCLKLSAEPNKQVYFAAGAIAYVIGAVFYVMLLREHSLAVMSVASSTLQLGLMISLSIWLFDERINVVQGSAMFMAVICASIAMLAATN